ncbi:hypothetical protein M514_14745 [Trichuris suis]|uniref:Uncharacterized protein n=1 Tax=Trichuris suis TaxID=68888 RepID=A0A085NTP5_9BILA|nr:hypothetical protein M514_14745 [Trichuris suis]
MQPYGNAQTFSGIVFKISRVLHKLVSLFQWHGRTFPPPAQSCTHVSPPYVMVSLPPVLLGFRSAYSEHLKSSVAELLCVEPLQLPGEFLSPNNYIKLSEDLSDLVVRL